MKYEQLTEVTARLLSYNADASNYFTQCRESGTQGDFYKDVKPFADKVKQCSDEWKQAALEWVKDTRPKHIHPIQIMNTAENLQMVSIRAFFPDSSLKRFQSHIQSNDYVLNRILEELKQKQNP